MSGFVGNLDVRLLKDDDVGDWLLLAPFAWNWFEVPAGFKTDFCTVPRLPFIYRSLGNTMRKAGTVHDWLYTSKIATRADADAALRQMILDEGGAWWMAQAFYLAVRIFGGSHW